MRLYPKFSLFIQRQNFRIKNRLKTSCSEVADRAELGVAAPDRLDKWLSACSVFNEMLEPDPDVRKSVKSSNRIDVRSLCEFILNASK